MNRVIHITVSYKIWCCDQDSSLGIISNSLSRLFVTAACSILTSHAMDTELILQIIASSKQIFEKDPSHFQDQRSPASLMDFLQQLRQKKEILVDLGIKIIALIEEDNHVESEVLETEEIQGFQVAKF